MAGTEAELTRLRELFRPTLEFLGYELYDLKLTGSGGHPTLLVAIDRPQEGSLEDCEKVSKSLSALLDQADPLPTRYDREVSSPGAERPLRTIDEYRRFLGRRANIRYRTGESERVAEGQLLAVSSEQDERRLGDLKKHEGTRTVPVRK